MKAKTLIGLTAMLAAFVVLMVGDWSSGRAQPVASITLPSPGVTKQLYPGCNNIGLTFPNGTSSGDVIAAVSPAGSVEAMWRHDAAQQRWEAFSAAAPTASDLLTVNFLDAIWVCIVGGPPTATAPAGQSVTPASTATPTAPAGQTGTPTSIATRPTTSPGQTATPVPGSPTPGSVSTAVPPTGVLTSFRYTMQTSIEEDAEMAVSISSSGAFKAPDRISCALTASAGGMTFDMGKLIVIPPDAWVDMGEGWTHTTASDQEVVDNLELCPGSSLFWESLELPADLEGIPGHLVTVNGVAAVKLSLVGLVQSLPILGVIPEGATVRTFDIWVAQDGGWVAALAFDATVIRMQVYVTNPNDASIHVDQP